MLELLLLYRILLKKGKKQKEEILETIEELNYNPGLISEKEIDNAVQEMQKYIFHAALLIYTQILSLLKDQTVIQFQMYGIGSIWRKRIRDENSCGTFQLAVALKLVSKFKEKFPKISMTSQEPCHLQAEIEYLQTNDIHVFDRETFSSDYFHNSFVKRHNNILKPAMICYMIHFSIYDFENFLCAHWSPEILSKIIFVGNSYSKNSFLKYAEECKKAVAFFEMVIRKSLLFEYPNFNNDPKLETFREFQPFYDHPSDFLAWKAFHCTEVYQISYQNAEDLIQKVF